MLRLQEVGGKNLGQRCQVGRIKCLQLGETKNLRHMPKVRETSHRTQTNLQLSLQVWGGPERSLLKASMRWR